MSTAVKEQEPVVYEMPRPKVGQDVDWFSEGDKSKARRASIRRVYQHKVELIDRMGGAYPIKTCFHCDYPGVLSHEMHEDVRNMGTWDFTPEEKHRIAFEKETRTDILNLSKRLEALENARPSKRSES